MPDHEPAGRPTGPLRDADGIGPFLSTLTAPQFAVSRHARIQPLGAVMGCDVRWLSVELPLPEVPPKGSKGYHLPGVAPRYEGDIHDVDELDHHFREARRRVRERLAAEAAALGANLVVALRHQPTPVAYQATPAEVSKVVARQNKRQPRVSRALELQLMGTAARDPRADDGTIRLSTLTMAEFAQLRAAGWEPAGVVGGSGHVFGGHLVAGSVARELPQDTAVWERARELALHELEKEAMEAQADGVIGLSIDTQHQSIAWTRARSGSIAQPSSLVGVNMLGTAIRRVARHSDTVDAPQRILLLR